MYTNTEVVSEPRFPMEYKVLKVYPDKIRAFLFFVGVSLVVTGVRREKTSFFSSERHPPNSNQV